MRESLQSDGEGSLEDRSFTLVYGQNLVEVYYLHLCAESSKLAEVSTFLLTTSLISTSKFSLLVSMCHTVVSEKKCLNTLTTAVKKNLCGDSFCMLLHAYFILHHCLVFFLLCIGVD